MSLEFNHFDKAGNAVMVDVSGKRATHRSARATGTIHVSRDVMEAVVGGTSKKGDVLGVARIAGIMAAKKTPELIPLCHTVPLCQCSVDFQLDEDFCEIRALCEAKTEGVTGVEMEALTGVTAALLTIYDMCKAIDKNMEIGQVHLLSKSGGKSGDFIFQGEDGSLVEDE